MSSLKVYPVETEPRTTAIDGPRSSRSQSITSLVKALAEAQAEIEPPKKSKTAKLGTYSYQYADLAAVRDAYKGPLSKRGMVVSHSLTPVDGHVVLTTTLMHTSGEWISSDYPIPTYEKPQEQGSALTYFKRYNVCALLDIVAEDDDDGATAQAGTPQPRHDAAPPDPNSDDVVILTLAQELGLITGQHPEDVIKAFSSFMGTDKADPTKKREVFFKDPRKETSKKWKGGVREKLERELKKVGAIAAVGSDEPPF